MENRREEIQGLKRLLVGVLVAALLITMLPFESMGTLVFGAEGEMESPLQTGVLANAKVVTIVDTTKDDGQGGQTEYTPEDQILDYLNEFSSETYENGLILKNGTTEALDFSNSSLVFPKGKVGLDLGENDLYASYIDVSAMGTEEGAEQPYAAIYGDEGSGIYNMDSYSDFPETSVQIGDKAALEISGSIDLDEVAFSVGYGQELVINGEDLSVENAEETRFYKANNYKILLDSLLQTTYYEEIHDIEGNSFDILGYKCPVSQAMDVRYYVFEAGVIPADMDILYLDNTYLNPGTALRADYEYGLYNITGTEMTIYAVYPVENNSAYMYAGYFNVLSNAEASFVVDGGFNIEIRDSANEWGKSTVSCSKVTFADGSLRYTATDDMGTVYNANKIYNETYIPISASVPIYVLYSETTLVDPNLADKFSYTYSDKNAVIKENNGTYIKAGTILTLTPVEGMVIYNINDGGMTMSANSENIVYKPNGDRVISIPSTPLGKGITFEISTEETVEDTEIEKYISRKAVFDRINNVDYYSGESSIMGYEDSEYIEGLDGSNSKKKHYDIALEGATEFFENGIEITTEGKKTTASIIVIDKSMEMYISEALGTEVEVPSATYGMQKKLTYTYIYDKASPHVTGVIATDGEGSPLELDGEWVEAGGNAPDLAMIWINKVPVTITMQTDATDTIGYAYSMGVNPTENDWTESNTVVLEEDNQYDLFFYARDEFDAATGRMEGEWRTSLGIDTTAPIIYYTDANYAPEGSETADLLDSSDANYQDYEGNLYLETSDNGSGVSNLTLQKLDNNVWVECNSELLQDENLMMDYVYFIRPTTKDVTYKLEITDNVGNTKTYDSFTLKGYVQDISVEVTNNTGVYNQELMVNVRITNTSTTNSVDNLTYVIRESDTVFTPKSGEIATLAPGASHDITLNVPVGKDAGEYLSTLDIQYTSTGDILENTIEKVYSHEITAEIEKAEGEGSVSVEDIYYGEEIAYKAESVTNGTDDVTLFFRNADDETTEFTTDIPTEVGTYEVKAVFAESDNYAETVTGITTFSITRMPATADMYEVEAPKTEEGWYGDEITITGLNGNLLSVTEDGTYSETITVSENYQFYIKTTSGAITEQVTLTDLKIDKDLPVIYADGEELVSGGTYNQTIYLSFEDASSGVTNFSIEGNTDCIVEAEDGGMYLLQDAQDQVYSITAIDAVGNSVTYSEFTIKAYTQNIEVTVTNNTVIYGATSEISIHIKNVSSTTLSDIEYRIEGGETDDVFSPLSDVVEVINPGETVTVDIPLTGNADAGVYSVNVEVRYTEDGEIEATNIDKIYTQEFEVTIEKAEGTGTVAIEDYYYGEKGSLVVNSDTNETYTVYYKDVEDETAEFTETVPTATGKYIVRVVFDASTNYEQVIIEDEFNINRLTPSKEMYEYGIATNETGWITEDIIITVQEGYTISATEEGTYTNQLVISESVESYTFYVKTETGAITEAVVLGAFQIDTTAPEVAEKEGIYAVEKWWQSFLKVITFGAYEAETTQVEIKAHDNESGIANISYYISTEAVALADIESVAKWTEGTELTISKSDYEQFIVYAKVENEAGLVTYLSTDGIKLGATETPVEPETPEAPVEPETPAETVVTLGEGKVSLEAGIAYKLEEGTWNVAGDPTDYKGGIVFYVEEDGEYEFTKK